MKRRGFFKAAAIYCCLALAAAAAPQEDKKPADEPIEVTFAGFLDASATANFNHPESRTSALRSYDAKADSFTFNALHAAASFDFGGGAAAVVELDAGSDASVNRLDPDGVDKIAFDVQEAYVTYVLPDTGFGFKAGKMVTFMGIEVIESPDNPTITRGFLFGLAECFTHTGFFATWKEGPFDAALGAANGWDVVTDNNAGKTALGKLSFTSEDGYGVTTSFMIGPEQDDNNHSIRRSADATGFVSPCGAFRLNLQALWGDDEVEALSGHRVRWYGFGVQPVATLTEALSVGMRVEWFKDLDGARTGVAGGTAATNVTLAPALHLSRHLLVRAEGRYDHAADGVFEDDEGGFKDHQVTLSLEVVARY